MPSPHVTSSKFFQLLVLPQGDVLVPSGMVVCCPFTRIVAEGKTLELALTSWEKKAIRQFGANTFTLPSTQSFCTRKVWLTDTADNKSIFMVDFAANISHDPVFIFPSSKQVTACDYLAHELGAFFDWKVSCSPITQFQEKIIESPLLNPISNAISC